VTSHDALDVSDSIQAPGGWVYEMDDLDDIVGFVESARGPCAKTDATVLCRNGFDAIKG
jgi:hypothetical protein